MFENWKNLEGTYVNPIVVENRMTSIDEVRKSIREKNPDASKEILEGILERLELVEVKYLAKDNKVYKGHILVDKQLVINIVSLFKYIEEINNNAVTDSQKFFIDKIIPITNKAYEGDDESSMRDNNTSAHNYRNIKDTKRLTLHAFGFALDINPRENPLVQAGEKNQPSNGNYDESNPNTLSDYTPSKFGEQSHALTPGQKIVRFLIPSGFEWGGHWKTHQDYQHFEKVIPTKEYVDYFLEIEINRPDIEQKYVINKIERLIYNNIAGKYTEHLIRLLADPKVAEVMGKKEHEKFSLFLNEHLGDKF